MPLSVTALAEIIRNEILALGAVPVLTAVQLQQENAENLLWTQLLALLSGLGMNEYLFRGATTIVNVAVGTNFPAAAGIVISDVNFPIGSVLQIKMNGSLANTSAGAVRFQVGFGGLAGGDIVQPNAIGVGAGVVIANWTAQLQLTRVDATNFRVMYSQMLIDARTPGIGVGTANLTLAVGDTLRLLGTMDVADPLASITLNNATIQSFQGFETIDT